MFFDHVLYEDIFITIATLADIGILGLMIYELPKVVTNINEIREATTGTVYGDTDDLIVGSRVHVLPRDKGSYDTTVYVIREVDKVRDRAMATPVLAPPQGPIPFVEGPMRGPKSPFVRLSIPG